MEKLRGRVSLTLIGFAPWGETAAAGCRWLTGEAWRLSSEWSRRAGRGWRLVERFLFVGLKSLGSGLDVRWRVDKERDEMRCSAWFSFGKFSCIIKNVVIQTKSNIGFPVLKLSICFSLLWNHESMFFCNLCSTAASVATKGNCSKIWQNQWKVEFCLSVSEYFSFCCWCCCVLESLMI